MEPIDIVVKKNRKGDLLKGPFFIKELSFDDFSQLQTKAENADGNARLVQMCLVDQSGDSVFKPQQVNVIKDRISGVDFTACLIVANGKNDFDKLTELAEKYKKN